MEKKYISLKEDPNAVFSDIVIYNDILYVSGLVSQDLESGELLLGDITMETKQTLDNLETILKQYGSGMDKVLRCEVFLHDFAERDAMNEEYRKHFPAGKMPSRICVGGLDMAAGCKIEIMTIAHL